MSNLRTLCRPHSVFSFISCRHQFRSRASFRNPNCNPRSPSPSLYSTSLGSSGSSRTVLWFRVNQRRTVAKASKWDEEKSPYETLELERDADEEQIKIAYRRLAKFYHPYVYDGRGTLEEGETAEARFIKIQAAYELLIDEETRRKYDMDNRVNPMKKPSGKAFENDSITKHSKNAASSYPALDSLIRMNRLMEKPTKSVLCTALSSCAKAQNWHLGLQIHAYLIRSGYEDSLFLSSALIDFYAKCFAIVDARKVFRGMKIHDQVSWTSLIVGFSANGQGRDAFLLFKEMLGTHIKPNCFTFTSVINACVGQNESLQCCSTLHAHVVKRGFTTSNFVICSLIDCYANCELINDALLLFNETSEKDTVLYNSMISAYSQNLCGEEALQLFGEMRQNNLIPTDHSLCTILNACSSLALLLEGRQVHSLVIKMGSERNVFVASALVDMYSKGGDIDEARFVLVQTSVKNNVLWTTMIMGYAQSGRGLEALELFDRLLTEKELTPDHICFTAILKACNHAGFLEKGVEYFNKMRTNYGLSPHIDQYACLVDLYARKGNLRKARDLMEEMPYHPNYVIRSSFLSSCKVYGDVELGKEAADQLIRMEPCNAAPYLTLAHIYASKGLWNEVAEVRSRMQRKKIRKPSGWSWVEVD